MLLCCLFFLCGVVLVVKGGDYFVDAAARIARALRVPTFVIGATVVSLATTMPETIVSALAAAEGKNEMAIGNAVGSVTANTALVLAAAMIAMPIFCDRKRFLRPILLLVAACVTLLLSSLGGELSVPGSVILGGIFLLFMIGNLRAGRREAREKTSEPEEKQSRKERLQNVLLFLLGAAGIVVGSRLMVDSGGEIALRLGVPERVVALTLVAIGTSLPELVTTVTAILKKEAGLSVGNIIGANVIDLSLILPLCSLISKKPLPVPAAGFLALDLPFCLGVTLLSFLPLLLRQKAAKWQGILLLLSYAVYLFLIL
ncbi:MAG: calcium/sodium antiporter [Clostridia bacterium]|nr:calcium/sodium antiporter [Clostridia bacterium]